MICSSFSLMMKNDLESLPSFSIYSCFIYGSVQMHVALYFLCFSSTERRKINICEEEARRSRFMHTEFRHYFLPAMLKLMSMKNVGIMRTSIHQMSSNFMIHAMLCFE